MHKLSNRVSKIIVKLAVVACAVIAFNILQSAVGITPSAEAAPTCTGGLSDTAWGVYGSAQFDPTSITLAPDGSVIITLDSIICNASDHDVLDRNYFENGKIGGKTVLTILDGTVEGGFFTGFRSKEVYVPKHSSRHLYFSVNIKGKASDGTIFFPNNGSYSIGIRGFGYVYDYSTGSGSYTNVVTTQFNINVSLPGYLNVYKHKIENGLYATAGTLNPPGNADITVGGITQTTNPASFSLRAGSYNVGLPTKDEWYPYYYRYWAGNNPFASYASGFTQDGTMTGNSKNVSVTSKLTSRLDVWYDPPPIGVFENISCQTGGTLGVAGWAVDKSPAGYSTDVVAYEGNSTGPIGGPITSEHASVDVARSDVNSGFSVTGSHGYSFSIGGSFEDGVTHYIYMYAINKDKNGTKRGASTYIGKKSILCTPQPVFYPWLQTQKGDVTSLQSISAQDIGVSSNNDDKPGARRKNSPLTESDYVVTAALNKDNFCSNNLYVLGKNIDQRRDCQTGGYTPEAVNFDNVKTALNNAWNKNGAGAVPGASACKPYNTSSSTSFNSVLSLGTTCVGGSIQRSGALTLGETNKTFNVTGGKVTLWVQGDLTINSNIVYSSAGVLDINTLPNLVIFVEGDVKIDQGVTQIDASIVSMKSINSCTQSATTGPACSLALVNNGYWATANSVSGSFNNFSRRKFDKNNPNGVPAELLILTPQSIVFPPPGLDQSDADINSQLQINSGELAPRLN